MWGAEDDQCVLSELESFEYGDNNVITVVVLRDELITPTVIGLATQFSANKELPASLQLDPTTGVISGRLQASLASDFVFTITASDTQKSVSLEVRIQSITVNCDATDIYPETPSGSFVPVSCPEHYKGYGRVYCLGGTFGEPEYSQCFLRNCTVFSYPVQSLTLQKGEAMIELPLLTDSIFTSFSISPELPAGLTLSSTGSISGTPQEASASQEYVVSSQYVYGPMSTSVFISVLENGCEQLDSFPPALNGATSESEEACGEFYHGKATRYCENGAFGPIDTSQCVLDAPTSISYTQTQFTVTAGEFLSSSDPTVVGIVTSFALASGSASLPNGISLNNRGVLAGVTRVVGTTTVTVEAKNSAGSATVSIQITVEAAGCMSLDGVPVANGDTIEVECYANYTGTAVQSCDNGYLSEIDYSGCVPRAPEELEYEDIVVEMYSSFQSSFPHVIYTVDSFSLGSALPAGVQFDESTGNFYGNPTEEFEGVLNVTAQNAGGSTTAELSLKVIKPSCSATEDLPKTEVDKEVSVECSKFFPGYKGTLKATCVLNGTVAMWSTPSEFCSLDKVDIFMVIGIILIILGILILIWGILLMIKRNTKKLPKTVKSETA